MSSGVTDFGTGAWLGALFGVDPDITGYFIALCSEEPGRDTDGTILAAIEPVDPSYVRQAYGTGGANWGLNDTYLTTLNDIDFGVPSVDWGSITHYALCTNDNSDPLDLGDVYAFGEFLNPQYVSAAVDMTIPAGGVVIAMASLENAIAV